MKKQLIIVLIFVMLLLVEFSGCFEEKNTSENNDTNSQKMELEFDISVNSSYIVGEPIIVTATLTNIGSEAVNISAMNLEVGTLGFYITTPDEKNIYYVGPQADCCPSIIMFKPNQQLSIFIDLKDEGHPFGESIYEPNNFSNLGEYKIKGEYGSLNESIGNLNSSIHTFTITPNTTGLSHLVFLNFSSSECGVFSFDESETGVNETLWLDNTTLHLKANVLINCGEEILNGSYQLINDTITLNYIAPECSPENCMDCMCGVVLFYNFTNLLKKNYTFSLVRLFELPKDEENNHKFIGMWVVIDDLSNWSIGDVYAFYENGTLEITYAGFQDYEESVDLYDFKVENNTLCFKIMNDWSCFDYEFFDGDSYVNLMSGAMILEKFDGYSSNPLIDFDVDKVNSSLKVSLINQSNLYWDDFEVIGNAVVPSGQIDVGDTITNCTANILIRHISSNTFQGVWVV